MIYNTLFEHNIKGQILLKAVDLERSELSTKIEINYCHFHDNNPWKDALFTIKTNSELLVENSVFNKTYSISRGSVILADYTRSSAKVYNTTFVNNFALYGGIFYVHHYSYVEMNECQFYNNYALQGAIATV